METKVKSVVTMDDFAVKLRAKENKEITARVQSIKRLFAGDCSDEMMEALALYIGELEPGKRQVFADVWAEVLAGKE